MKRTRRLGVSILANLISMCVSLGVSFILTPFLISSIGKEAYSFFPIANNFVSYMTIVTAALNSMAARFITVAYSAGRERQAKAYFSSVFYSNIILSVILLVPMVFIVSNIARILDIPEGLEQEVALLFILVFTASIVSLISSVFNIATFAKERMDLNAVQSIVMNILKAGLFLGLFYFFKPNIVYIGIVTLIIAMYNLIVGVGFTKRLMPEYVISKDRFNSSAIKELVHSGIWNSINNLGAVLILGLSQVLANSLIGATAGGDVSIIHTLPNFMNTVMSTVFGVLLSHITVEYAKGNAEATKECVLYSQKVLGIIASVPIVIIFLFGRHFFELWVPGEDAGYLQTLSIINVCPLLIHSAMWPVTGLNTVNNKVKVPALVFAIIGVCNLILTVIALRYTNLGIFAILGVGSVCDILYYFAFVPRYAAKHMGFNRWTFYPHILRTFVFAIMMILLFGTIISKMQITNWFTFFLASGLMEIWGVILYLFIVFRKKDRELLRLKIASVWRG